MQRMVLRMQIVGLKGGMHTMAVLSGVTDHIHGARLGQAGEIEINFAMQSELPPTASLAAAHAAET